MTMKILRIADTPSNTGTHDTCGETVGDNGRQGRGQRRQTYHQRHTCGETMGDKKGRQHVGKADPPSNTGKRVGRQCETMRSMGQKGIQGETRPWEGRHAIQHRHTCGETMGGKTSGRRTHHPTQTHMWEDNEKHWETRGRQDIENANTSSNTGTRVGTRQRGKSGDTPSNKKETRREHWVGDKGRQDQGGHLKNALRTPVHCLEDKKGDNVERRGARCSGRRTHQPTKANKKGYRRRQKETRPSAKGNKKGRNAGEGETRPSGRRTHHPTKGNKKGYNGRHDRQKGGHTNP